MKLSEMFDETVQYMLVGKLLKKDIPVTLDYHEFQRDFTRWHNGQIVDIVHATGPDTNNFLVWYERQLGNKKMRDSVRIQHAQFDRLHLHKRKGEWYLSSTKPSPDDEEV